MNEEQIANLTLVLEEMANDPLCPFSCEEKMPLEYRDEWNEGMEEPRYTNTLLEYLKNEEFESREHVFAVFDDFFARCEAFIQSIEEAEVFLALFQNFKENYIEKIRHSLDIDQEQELNIINRTIKKLKKFIPGFFDLGDHPYENVLPQEEIHGIPKKLLP